MQPHLVDDTSAKLSTRKATTNGSTHIQFTRKTTASTATSSQSTSANWTWTTLTETGTTTTRLTYKRSVQTVID